MRQLTPDTPAVNTETILALLRNNPLSCGAIAHALETTRGHALRHLRPLISSGRLYYVRAADLPGAPATTNETLYSHTLPQYALPVPHAGTQTRTIHRSAVLDLLLAENGHPMDIETVATRLHCTPDAARSTLESLADDRFVCRAGDEYEAYETAPPIILPTPPTPKERVYAQVAAGRHTVKLITTHAQMKPNAVRHHLRDLLAEGAVTRTVQPHFRAHRYEIADPNPPTEAK